MPSSHVFRLFFFFFNDTATTEIYTLSLHDALPICHKWPDGRPVILVLRDPSTPEMQTAIQKLYHMQPDEFKALLAPHQSGVIMVRSEEELLKSVESIPGAVGLVDVYSINGRVNVLKVDGKLPLEQGYYLKGRSEERRVGK